jgi:GNAT superfamily N-acetyltransferase
MHQSNIRRCRSDEQEALLTIVNAAAQRYRGVIPQDRWSDPYMSAGELAEEIEAGVEFWGFDDGAALAGIMGVQPRGDVDLIRHAYVSPGHQGRGMGTLLLHALEAQGSRPILIGTWAAAHWAIRFYERNGYVRAGADEARSLLRRYWTVPERQIDTSVVLTKFRR